MGFGFVWNRFAEVLNPETGVLLGGSSILRRENGFPPATDLRCAPTFGFVELNRCAVGIGCINSFLSHLYFFPI
jgi:hypothetical protein